MCEAYAYAGLGAALLRGGIPCDRFDATVRRYLHAVVAASQRVPERSRASFFEGLGQGVGVRIEFSVLDRLDFIIQEIDRQIPESRRPSVYLGFGRGIGWRFGEDPRRSDDLIARVDDRYRSHGWQGLRQFLERLSRFY